MAKHLVEISRMWTILSSTREFGYQQLMGKAIIDGVPMDFMWIYTGDAHPQLRLSNKEVRKHPEYRKIRDEFGLALGLYAAAHPEVRHV